jgi:hypothetical protein
MKKIIVPIIILALVNWQLPIQSQEVHVQMHIAFDFSSEVQSSIAYLDPPIPEKMPMTINLEYTEFQLVPSGKVVDGIFILEDLERMANDRLIHAINQDRIVPADRSNSIIAIRSLPAKAIHTVIPNASKLHSSGLPNWIKPASAGWPSTNRMQLPEVFGIKFNF